MRRPRGTFRPGLSALSTPSTLKFTRNVKFASKDKNNVGIQLTHSGFTELGRDAERFTDHDLYDAAMKPDDKKRRGKSRVPAGHCGGGGGRKQTVKAGEYMKNAKAGKRMAGTRRRARSANAPRPRSCRVQRWGGTASRCGGWPPNCTPEAARAALPKI